MVGRSRVQEPGERRTRSSARSRSGFESAGRRVKSEVEEKDARHYRMERSYGTFARNLRLPTPVDEKLINATFKNGVLTILLPKTAEAKAHTIPIKNV